MRVVGAEIGAGGVGVGGEHRQLQVLLDRALPALRAGRRRVEVVLVALLEQEVAVLAHVQGDLDLAGQYLQRVPVEIVVELRGSLHVEDVGAEVAARGRLQHVAQLVAVAVAELRPVVGVEGLVGAPAVHPEEAGAGVVAAVGRVAEVREQDPARAPVVADRVDQVGRVEDRDALQLEDGVRGLQLVVDLDLGRARLEAPARVRLAARGEAAALDLVGLVVDALDAAALDEDAGLDVAHRVRQEAVPGVVHLERLAPETLVAADEGDVALGDDAVALLAVGVRHLEDVGLVGLDPHAGEVQVHEPARLDVALGHLLVRLGAHAHLARVGGRRGDALDGAGLRLGRLRRRRRRRRRRLLRLGVRGPAAEARAAARTTSESFLGTGALLAASPRERPCPSRGSPRPRE